MESAKLTTEEIPSCSSHVARNQSPEMKRRKIDFKNDNRIETELADEEIEPKDAEMSPADSSASSTDSDEELDVNVPSIVDSVALEQIDEFKHFPERYFTKKYCTKFTLNSVNLDTCIKVHTNKIYLVYLSEKHSVIQNRQRIKYLNFKVGKKINRLKNMMTGKGKRGAQFLQPDSVLCYIQTEDGCEYPVHAGVYGKLLEVNTRILTNQNLLIDDLNEGFLAIILPDLKKHDDDIKALISNEEYNN